MTWLVELDGRNVGTISKGGSLAVRSAPGRHTIVIGPRVGAVYGRSKPFEFDAIAGEQVNISVRAGPSRPSIWLSAPGPLNSLGLLYKSFTAQRRNQSPPATARSGAAAGPAAPAPVGATVTSVRVLEGSRYEVSLGDERRTIDNSQSSSPSIRVVRLTREWVKKCTVDTERITTFNASASLGIPLPVLKIEAERTLTSTYSTSMEKHEIFEEEVTINVAPRTNSLVMFSWKEIRQMGLVQVTGETFTARIPYEVTVGLTFDQQQIDR